MPADLIAFEDVYPPVMERLQVLRQRTSPHLYAAHHSAAYNLTFALSNVMSEMWQRDEARKLSPAAYCLENTTPETAAAGTLALALAVANAAERVSAGEDAPDVFREFALRLQKVDPAVRTAVMARLGEYYVGAGLSALGDVTFRGEQPVTAHDWDRLRDMTSRFVAELVTAGLHSNGS